MRFRLEELLFFAFLRAADVVPTLETTTAVDLLQNLAGRHVPAAGGHPMPVTAGVRDALRLTFPGNSSKVLESASRDLRGNLSSLVAANSNRYCDDQASFVVPENVPRAAEIIRRGNAVCNVFWDESETRYPEASLTDEFFRFCVRAPRPPGSERVVLLNQLQDARQRQERHKFSENSCADGQAMDLARLKIANAPELSALNDLLAAQAVVARKTNGVPRDQCLQILEDYNGRIVEAFPMIVKTLKRLESLSKFFAEHPPDRRSCAKELAMACAKNPLKAARTGLDLCYRATILTVLGPPAVVLAVALNVKPSAMHSSPLNNGRFRE